MRKCGTVDNLKTSNSETHTIKLLHPYHRFTDYFGPEKILPLTVQKFKIFYTNE